MPGSRAHCRRRWAGWATGVAEREAVPVMLDDARQRGYRPRTLGSDRGYDTRECVRAMRNRGVTPHVARRTHSAIDGRTTRHGSYRASQKVRKQVEEVFGWMKTVGGFRRTRYRGVERTGHATPRPGKAEGAPLDLWTRPSGPIGCRWRMTRRDWPSSGTESTMGFDGGSPLSCGGRRTSA